MAGRAEIIDELEGSLPGWLRKHRMHGCYPRYIHFLKVCWPVCWYCCLTLGLGLLSILQALRKLDQAWRGGLDRLIVTHECHGGKICLDPSASSF